MKKLFLILLIITSISLFGQTNNVKKVNSTNPVTKTINVLQIQNKELQIKLETIDSTLQRVIENQNYVQKENDLFKSTINANTNIFNGISTFFTIISILLTLIVIAIPLVNYFLVLKPNEKVVKKVENLEAEVLKTMEGNFESYFEKLRRQKTTKILSLLGDTLKLSEVTNYFLLNDSDNLEEADILKIIEFLKTNKEIEKTDAIVLNSIVIESGLLIAEKYYKSIFENDENESYEYAINYLVENNFEDHIPYIEKIISANEKGHHLLIEFFDYIQEKYLGRWMDKRVTEKREIGILYSKLLFDNENILKAIENKEIPKTIDFEEHPIGYNRLVDNSFLRETKYYKIYLEEEDKKYK